LTGGSIVREGGVEVEKVGVEKVGVEKVGVEKVEVEVEEGEIQIEDQIEDDERLKGK
jgi:hypothetical protein